MRSYYQIMPFMKLDRNDRKVSDKTYLLMHFCMVDLTIMSQQRTVYQCKNFIYVLYKKTRQYQSCPLAVLCSIFSRFQDTTDWHAHPNVINRNRLKWSAVSGLIPYASCVGKEPNHNPLGQPRPFRLPTTHSPGDRLVLTSGGRFGHHRTNAVRS